MIKKHIWFSLFLIIIMCLMPNCKCRGNLIVIKSAVLEIPQSLNASSESLDRNMLAEIISNTVEVEPNFYFDKNNNNAAVLKIIILPPAIGSKSKNIAVILALLKQDPIKIYAEIPYDENGISGETIKLTLKNSMQKLYKIYNGARQDNLIHIKKIEDAVLNHEYNSEYLINHINILGDAKDEKALKPLINLLRNTTDFGVGNAAILALSEIGSDEAMPAIIEFAERKPPIIRRQAVIAAKKIGSKLAAEWLLVMALGYTDPVTQKEAAEALKEVEKKIKANN